MLYYKHKGKEEEEENNPNDGDTDMQAEIILKGMAVLDAAIKLPCLESLLMYDAVPCMVWRNF